ncbi:MAG: hypothetical protein ABIG68_08575, partial [Acidobacteriota bacterium]
MNRDKEEPKPGGIRRGAEEEFLQEDDELLSLPTAQSLDTLREGYSWIRALESRYPGWSLASVDGFPFTLPVKPLADSKVCLVSLAGVHRKGQKHFGTHPVAVPRALKTMGFKERGDWSMRIIPGEVDPE